MVEPRAESILEAYAFYNVHNVIYEKYYARGIPVSDKNELMNFAAYTIPYVVNGALACEIALKSVLDLDISKKCLHHIDLLYNSLGNDYRQAILTQFMSYGLSEHDFSNSLTQSSDLFVDWRYYYEKNGVFAPNHFHELVESIYKGVFSFSPLIERNSL